MKYNNWELEGEEGAWFDLEHTDAPHDYGADWWWVYAASCGVVLAFCMGLLLKTLLFVLAPSTDSDCLQSSAPRK